MLKVCATAATLQQAAFKRHNRVADRLQRCRALTDETAFCAIMQQCVAVQEPPRGRLADAVRCCVCPDCKLPRPPPGLKANWACPACVQHYRATRRSLGVNYAGQRTKRRNALRAWVHEQQRGPCADCGIAYPPVVMQFDHVRGVKVESVSRMVSSGVGQDTIAKEIAKCEVVCANCHALRTHGG